MQTVAVGWQVYDITREPLQLGYVGLAQFAPMILLTLWAGDAADRYDRKRLILLSRLLLGVAALVLAALSVGGVRSVWPIYVVLAIIGVARAFGGPAAQALLPRLVPPEHFASAVAWSSSLWQVAVIAGPAIGGALYGLTRHAVPVYAACALLEVVSCAFTAALTTRTGSAGVSNERASKRLLAGLRYVWSNKLVLGAISLDLFAVLFGGAVALLPIYARDILNVGPGGLGLLRSAPAVGAGLVAVLLALRPLPRRAGAIMLACVAGFGAATIVFGLSRRFAVSLVALTFVGATDMVSVYVRQTLIQLATPDAMRGRVSAVNLAFIGASNELGEFESGAAAAFLGTVPAVVAGGAITMAIVLLWSALFPSLRQVDRLDERSIRGA